MLKHFKRGLPVLAILTFGTVSCSSMFVESQNTEKADEEFFADANSSHTEFYSNSNKRINTYSVTWSKPDGTVLRIDSNVQEGTIPVNDSDPSYKLGDSQFKFVGWQPTPAPIYSNAFYTAVFEETSTALTFKPHFGIDNKTIEYYTVTGVNKEYTKNTINIPNTYRGLPVMKIGEFAFTEVDNIEYINIPNSIVEIERHAFWKNTSVKELIIPASVKTVSEYAFEYAEGLKAVLFKGEDTKILKGAFKDAKSLENVTLPAGLITLESNMFHSCRSLNKVVLPETLTTIGYNAFYGSGLKEINPVPNLTKIDDQAFMANYNLKSFTFNDGLLEVGNKAFYETRLVDVNLPSSVKKIGPMSFASINTLRRVRLSESLEEIGENAFIYNDNIATVSMPKNIKKIGFEVFKYAYIPAFNYDGTKEEFEANILSKVDVDMFGKNSSTDKLQTSLVVENAYENYETFESNKDRKIIIWRNDNNKVLQVKYSDGTDSYNGSNPMKDPDDTYEYTFNQNWTTTENDKNNTEERKANYDQTRRYFTLSFNYNNGQVISYKKLRGESISIPEILPEKSGYVFLDWDKELPRTMPSEDLTLNAIYSSKSTVGLSYLDSNKNIVTKSWSKLISDKDLYLTDNNKTVSNTSGGYNYSKLLKGNLVLPNTITRIEDISCAELLNVVIPTSVTHIKNMNLPNMIGLDIPSSVKTIGSGAFANCSDLIKVNLTNAGLTSLSHMAFSNCFDLKQVNIGGSITDTGTVTFQNCRSLEEVIIGDSVKTIGVNVFDGCEKLKKVTLGRNVEEIQQYAFEGCEALTEINLPNSLKRIGYIAFADTGLKNIVIPNQITTLEFFAYSCDDLETIVIPTSVTTIEEKAFHGVENFTILYKGSQSQWNQISGIEHTSKATITYNYR